MIRRFFLFLLALALLIVGGLLVLRYVYGDAVKQSLLQALNERIQKEINVDDIELDVFGSFPYASLRLKNLQTLEPDGKTLIKASRFSILFNYVNMIKGQYVIERISIRDAFVNLIHYQDGSVNYELFKNPGTESVEGDNLKIRIREVQLTNVEVSYQHFPADQEYLFRVNRGKLQGDFSAKEQQFTLSGDFYSNHIRSGKTEFFKDYPLMLSLNIQLGEAGKWIRIHEGRMETSGLVFDLKGSIQTAENIRQLDLHLLCARSKLHDLMNIIPGAYLEPIKDYALDGEVGFTADFKGAFRANLLPAVQIDFWIEDGKLGLSNPSMNLTDLRLKGSFLNGKNHSQSTFNLTMNDIHTRFEGGEISGRLQIENFTRPLVSVAFSSDIDLAKIRNHIANENLISLKGDMNVDMEFQNRLKDFRKFTLHDFISSKTSGTLNISSVDFRLKDYPLGFSSLAGSFNFSNKDLLVHSFSGKVGENDFIMKGSFQNILAYAFLPDEPVFVDAVFESKQIDLEQLLHTSGEGSGGESRITLSPLLNFQIELAIDDFRFRKFSATGYYGSLSQQNQVFKISKASFRSMKGQVNMTGSIRKSGVENYRINCDAHIEDVDIHDLFNDFGNFGQENIRSENLAGHLTAQVHYESSLSSRLAVDPASVYALSDLIITNGELIDYAPMYKLLRFIQKDDLAHIRFSEMKNKVEIKDETVYLPSMNIQSNTLNLSLFGKHQFDNLIDYHVQLLLRELIGNKPKPQQVPGNDFVKEDEVGKTKLFIHMTGHADDPEIRYDMREVSKKIKAGMQAEGTKLKELFGNSVKDDVHPDKNQQDSLLIENPGGKNFNIEWEKPDSLPNKKSGTFWKKKKDKDKTKKQEFIIEWDETKDSIR